MAETEDSRSRLGEQILGKSPRSMTDASQGQLAVMAGGGCLGCGKQQYGIVRHFPDPSYAVRILTVPASSYAHDLAQSAD